MFCARVKITLDVLVLQIFLFSEEGWIGLSGYGIPIRHFLFYDSCLLISCKYLFSLTMSYDNDIKCKENFYLKGKKLYIVKITKIILPITTKT